MYPIITAATRLGSYQLGLYHLDLLGNIESPGPIRYQYILTVSLAGERDPFLYITAEANALADASGGGSYFLCTLESNVHSNLGASESWADLESFTLKALELARERLGPAVSGEELINLSGGPLAPPSPPTVSAHARPKNWYCLFCGWHCDQEWNDLRCENCGALRPFAGGSATMRQCGHCRQWSLALAQFCEWCGARFEGRVP